MIDIYNFYHKGYMKEKRIDMYGGVSWFKSATLNLPILITKIHTTRQLAESPTIELPRELTNYDVFTDLRKIVTHVLAFGEIYLIPFKLSDDANYIEIVFNNDKYYDVHSNEKNNELQYLGYKTQEIVRTENKREKVEVMHEHYMDNGVYYYKKYYLNASKIKIYLDGNTGIS